jgi:hypothetical protein
MQLSVNKSQTLEDFIMKGKNIDYKFSAISQEESFFNLS